MVTKKMSTAPAKKTAHGKQKERSIGELVDEMYMAKQAQSDAQKLADAHKSRAYALECEIIERFPKADISGAVGKLAKATIKHTEEPVIEDVAKLLTWAVKTKNYAVVQKRPGSKAIKELWDDNKVVPGVGKFDRVSVSLNKLTK